MFFFMQKAAYVMRISDWSADVCSSDLSSGQSLALLFNELIANAERHGALTSESGELHIEWKETDDGMICIHWSEQGLQGVLLPETRGFGFSVLQRIIKQIGRASCRERACQYV